MAKGGKSKKKAETVFLVCEETGDYNYTVRRKPGGEKLKLKNIARACASTRSTPRRRSRSPRSRRRCLRSHARDCTAGVLACRIWCWNSEP